LAAVAIGGCLLLAAIVLVAVPVIGVFAAIAIPNFVSYELKSKRAEVPGYVDGIKTSELAYNAVYDTFVAAGSREEAEAELRGNSSVRRAWNGGGGWDSLGWSPDGPMFGAYWVEVSPDGLDFTVHGLCDVDGDGEYAEYTATTLHSAMLVTAPDVY
jgi:type IV pilus assembly protein PilA